MIKEHFPAKVLIDNNAIVQNTKLVCDLAEEKDVMAIVKANAYGHGLLNCAKATIEGGAKILGVAKVAEALSLRRGLEKEGLNPRIFCWIYGPDAPYYEMVSAKLDVSITTEWEAQKFVEAVKLARKNAKFGADEKLKVHIKVDTGMSRNGFTDLTDEFEKAMTFLKENEEYLETHAVWTHLAWADSNSNEATDFTLSQLNSFDEWVEKIMNFGLFPKCAHVFASSALLRKDILNYEFKHGLNQLVRPGLLLYGITPSNDFAPQKQLEEEFGFIPAMSVTAIINNVKKISKNSGISYSQTQHVENDSWIGVVPLGYSDGILRSASGSDEKDGAPILVLVDVVNNIPKVAHIAGRVCMDQFLINLGEETNAKAGDEVVLFGAQKHCPRVNDWAEVCETIPYEILTSISNFAERVVL